ncbi:MAG: helix-turn-helix domain-containing protein [Saprospiraceae bacterium]
MIFISGITISFFLFFLILLKHQKNQADWILAVWFGAISIHQLLYYLQMSGYNQQYSFLEGLILPFPLIHGPLLFLYVSALVKPLPPGRKDYIIHTLPFTLCFAYMIPFMMLPAEQKHYVMMHNGVGYEAFLLIKSFAILILGFGYIIASLILIQRHQKNIRMQFSNLDKINLQWLKYLSYGLFIIWMVVVLGQEVHIFLAAIVFMMVIGFFGIRQVGIFSKHPIAVPHHHLSKQVVPEIERKEQVDDSEEQLRYEKSGLTVERKILLRHQLKTLMAEEKIFLDPDLSLDSLADRLDIHANYLSQFINEELGATFYDYINNGRVQEFIKRKSLAENQKFTILALAYDCGFNSKSSFNRHFKKVTGKSPSEYFQLQDSEAILN